MTTVINEDFLLQATTVDYFNQVSSSINRLATIQIPQPENPRNYRMYNYVSIAAPNLKEELKNIEPSNSTKKRDGTMKDVIEILIRHCYTPNIGVIANNENFVLYQLIYAYLMVVGDTKKRSLQSFNPNDNESIVYKILRFIESNGNRGAYFFIIEGMLRTLNVEKMDFQPLIRLLKSRRLGDPEIDNIYTQFSSMCPKKFGFKATIIKDFIETGGSYSDLADVIYNIVGTYYQNYERPAVSSLAPPTSSLAPPTSQPLRLPLQQPPTKPPVSTPAFPTTAKPTFLTRPMVVAPKIVAPSSLPSTAPSGYVDCPAGKVFDVRTRNCVQPEPDKIFCIYDESKLFIFTDVSFESYLNFAKTRAHSIPFKSLLPLKNVVVPFELNKLTSKLNLYTYIFYVMVYNVLPDFIWSLVSNLNYAALGLTKIPSYQQRIVWFTSILSDFNKIITGIFEYDDEKTNNIVKLRNTAKDYFPNKGLSQHFDILNNRGHLFNEYDDEDDKQKLVYAFRNQTFGDESPNNVGLTGMLFMYGYVYKFLFFLLCAGNNAGTFPLEDRLFDNNPFVIETITTTFGTGFYYLSVNAVDKRDGTGRLMFEEKCKQSIFDIKTFFENFENQYLRYISEYPPIITTDNPNLGNYITLYSLMFNDFIVADPYAYLQNSKKSEDDERKAEEIKPYYVPNFSSAPVSLTTHAPTTTARLSIAPPQSVAPTQVRLVAPPVLPHKAEGAPASGFRPPAFGHKAVEGTPVSAALHQLPAGADTTALTTIAQTAPADVSEVLKQVLHCLGLTE